MGEGGGGDIFFPRDASIVMKNVCDSKSAYSSTIVYKQLPLGSAKVHAYLATHFISLSNCESNRTISVASLHSGKDYITLWYHTSTKV